MVGGLVGGDNSVSNHPAADGCAGPAPATPAVDICPAAGVQHLCVTCLQEAKKSFSHLEIPSKGFDNRFALSAAQLRGPLCGSRQHTVRAYYHTHLPLSCYLLLDIVDTTLPATPNIDRSEGNPKSLVNPIDGIPKDFNAQFQIHENGKDTTKMNSRLIDTDATSRTVAAAKYAINVSAYSLKECAIGRITSTPLSCRPSIGSFPTACVTSPSFPAFSHLANIRPVHHQETKTGAWAES